MSHPQWQQSNVKHVTLLGELNRDTVPSLWKFIRRWKIRVESVEISLEKIDKIDSAGMVMLIHLIDYAKKHNCHIMLSSIPEELIVLFRLSRVEFMIQNHIRN
ncbi:anti sigma factor b [Candidatus Photodesmus blepharus]|uniref:Anti sigma factor b n=1 Tax=Candidatus Photodesmus blepharonis TaxID=1179155 RepID=A0A084CM37_9GAMM|nr:STAS domain-containing protein [Candidatus Photodesmus blepharus]KEY90866.1 anti sigma factor b [Candidatus Photodesmus blepharus]